MKIIDCKTVRNEMLQEAKARAQGLSLRAKYPYTEPALAIIHVGDDDASNVYVRNKIKTCEEVGIKCEVKNFPSTVTFLELLYKIKQLNDTPFVHGIILQLPLPDHLKEYERRLLDEISHVKDVDGLGSESMGNLWSGNWCHKPATAAGVMRLLPDDLSGKIVCIVGRSNLVGKPLIKMLMDRNATVRVCHSKTDDLFLQTFNSDIIITAIGKPKYITPKYTNMLMPQTWIDVGINRDENGKLCGDIDIDAFAKYEDHSITPVPRGVGILTTAQLTLNVIDACERLNMIA